MAEVEDMEHENGELDKRKTNPNASDDDYNPDPKRIHQVSEEEPKPEPVNYTDSNLDFSSTWKAPHQYDNQTILEFLFKANFVDLLAQKLTQNTQLKLLIDDLMVTLRQACVDGVLLENFAGKVNDLLLNCPDFVQACVDTYYEDKDHDSYYLLVCIDIYKNIKQPKERMESFKGDPFLDIVLGQTESFLMIRGVSSVLIGYFCDDAFYRKLCSVFSEIHRSKRRPSRTATFLRDEIVIGLESPATIEGLKDAIWSMYPANEAQFICEGIDMDKFYYAAIVGDREEDRIIGFRLRVSGRIFRIPFIWFSYNHWVLRKYMDDSSSNIVNAKEKRG